MTRFTVAPGRSSVSLAGRSSLHPVHWSTTAAQGFLDAQIATGAQINQAIRPAGRLAVEAEGLKSGNELYDLEMRRRLDTRRYPTIVVQLLELAETAPAGNGRYHATGDLTVRGMTRRVTGDLTLKRADERTLEVSGEQTFDIRDFGITPPSLLGLKVYPDVQVAIQLVLVQDS